MSSRYICRVISHHPSVPNRISQSVMMRLPLSCADSSIRKTLWMDESAQTCQVGIRFFTTPTVTLGKKKKTKLSHLYIMYFFLHRSRLVGRKDGEIVHFSRPLREKYCHTRLRYLTAESPERFGYKKRLTCFFYHNLQGCRSRISRSVLSMRMQHPC